MKAWVISGGQLLRDNALRNEDLFLGGGVVLPDPAAGAARLDARGLLVLPGIVDIHGDAHERQFQPRPGVSFPPALALRDSESQILAAGITTAFLGVTLSWEPGLRSVAAWRQILQALEAARPWLSADLRVHLRFEADNLDTLEEALADMEAGRVDLLAFNDHTPSIVRKLQDERQAAKYAERAGIGLDAFRDLARAAMARRAEVPEARRRMAEMARRLDLPMASHDEANLGEREAFRALGVGISEFPMAEAVAEAAQRAGEAVVMGAPNVVRGGSHLGWASAAPLAEQGLVTILASDYVWPALLEAAFILLDRGRLDLPAAWALISGNPARAARLRDRGDLLPGMRGDVVVVDPARRAPVAVFCAGRLAWAQAEFGSRLRQG